MIKRISLVGALCLTVLLISSCGDGDTSSGVTSDSGSGSVISPNGGETWKTGETRTILWGTGGAGTYAQIYLYKSGAYYADLTPYPEFIGGKTWNDGKLDWTIPSWLVESSEYKVRIISSSDDGINDYSDGYFTIN